jgi:hypothetical protein
MTFARSALIAVAIAGAAAVGSFLVLAHGARERIAAAESRIIDRARGIAAETTASVSTAALPAPVQRYFAFTFPNGAPRSPAASGVQWVTVAMDGDFRRPRTEGFAPTSARQVIRTAAPDMVFSADTPIFGLLWATASDIYIDGEMEMRAQLLSAMTVMEQRSTPALNRTSLRRRLLESPLYPMALLHGGPVTWEAIDDRRARAVVRAHGEEAALVATFRSNGSLESLDAETDGDLTTPYHGSGEHASRSDYRLVDGVMIPFGFEIARAVGGNTYPFWRGSVTSIAFGKR